MELVKKIVYRGTGGSRSGQQTEGYDDGLGTVRNIALVCKHFHISALDVHHSLPWSLWLPYLAVSLDLEEIEKYHAWCAAGNDPNKFPWQAPDHAGTREPGPVGIQATLMQLAKDMSGGKPLKKSDVWEYGKVTGMRKVFQAHVRDSETGKILRTAFFDAETKKEITNMEGYRFVASQHHEAKDEARQFFGTGR